MPKPSMTRSLESDQKAKIDQFVEDNYLRLKEYALYQTQQDQDKAEDLLHDAIYAIYEGRMVLDLTKSPMTYFQFMLKGVAQKENKNCQKQFERGIVVNHKKETAIRKGKKKVLTTYVLTPMNTVSLNGDSYEHSTEPFNIESLDRHKRLEIFEAIKQRLRNRRKWIVEQIEKDIPPQAIYAAYVNGCTNPISWHLFTIELSRIYSRIRQAVEARLQDAE